MADKMVLLTLALGSLGFTSTSANAMLAIINADYGTGIRVAAPIVLLASLGNAAKHGRFLTQDHESGSHYQHLHPDA